jgi:hypothetical protein
MGPTLLLDAQPAQQSFFLDWPAYGYPCDVETDRRQTGNAEGARGNLRHIDYSSADERAAIGDPHHSRAPSCLIIDMDQRSEWQRAMRR